MRILWTILIACPFIGSAHGQAPPASLETEADVADILRQADRKKVLAVRAIHQNPDRVAEQTDRIMAKLDSLFQERIQKRFDTHYEAVEQALETVSLPQDIGSMEVFWQQLKAGVGNTNDLDILVKDFIGQAQSRIEPKRQELIEFLDTQLEETLTGELEQAQNSIREPFLMIIADHFPVWDAPRLSAPSLPNSGSQGLQKKDRSYMPGSAMALAGLAAGAVAARTSKKIVGKAFTKVLAKGAAAGASGAAAGAATGPLAPFVTPVLGVLMATWTAYDVWDATQAKRELERELRTELFIKYKEGFSPAAIWSMEISAEGGAAFHQQVAEEIHSFLRDWTDHCRMEAEKILDAAQVYDLSPDVKEYIAEQARNGRDTREIVEDIATIEDIFGRRMIARAPFKKLSDMLVLDPDRSELLARLARALDIRLLEEYDRYGREMLDAADLIGVPTFVEAVHGGRNLDWQDVLKVFQWHPGDLSESARRGLLLAIEERAAASRIPSTTLENIDRHKQLFRTAASLAETDTLFRLFGNPSVLSTVDWANRKDSDVAHAFLVEWTDRTWEGYDREQLGALMDVADYRVGERNQSLRDFAREIGEHDVLTPIRVEFGLDGVRLWDSYVGPTTGQHQRRQAESAISLHRKGFPIDVLMTSEGLAQARVLQYVPFGFGPLALELLRPLGKLFYAGMIIIVLLIVAYPVVRLWKLLRGNRSTSRRKRLKIGESRQTEYDGTNESAERGRSWAVFRAAKALFLRPIRRRISTAEDPNVKSEAG